jgi:hypothetical protein
MSTYDLLHNDPISMATQLRMEVGWQEVAKGLGRILLGYFVLILGLVVGFGIIVLVGGLNGLNGAGPTQVLPLDSQIGILIAVGILAVAGLTSWGFLVTGYWQCLMNAPDRRGVKWLVFTSMTCVLIGPVMNIAASIYAADTPEQSALIHSGYNRYYVGMRARVGAYRHLQPNSASSIVRLAGTVLSVMSGLLFILFLRAAARCFANQTQIWNANLYLLYMGGLIAGTVFLLQADPRIANRQELWLGLLAGYGLAFVWYLFLVAGVRACIHNVMSCLRSPLDMG